MENRLERQIKIPMSICDNTNRISLDGIVDLFMDYATEHGDSIGVGRDVLAARNLIWVAAKTKIKINRRPENLETVNVATWPETPGRIRFNRYYSLTQNGQYLVEGKTEWAILDLTNGRPHKLDEMYPVDMEHHPEVVCDTPFTRMSTDFDDCEVLKTYTVSSNDIDISQHMNNVAYIRAVLGCFSCKEIEDMNITEFEAVYRSQCFEGENLTFKKRVTENGMEIGIIKEDGSTATVIRLA